MGVERERPPGQRGARGAVDAAAHAEAAAVAADGELKEARSAQATAWLWSEIGDTLIDRFRSDTKVATLLPGIEKRVAAGHITPAKAALQLLEAFGNSAGAGVTE